MIQKRIALVLFFLIAGILTHAQTYTAKVVAGDPYNVHYYTLKNGLTVALSVNKTSPQIQTAIAVRTGSKNDPADNTGLAHYLEHLLFKGTENFGTKSYSAEKYYLSKIEGLYNLYGQTTDSLKRLGFYSMIDSVSFEASKIAIANEYDRMMQSIGATGTNAFTSTDQTVYINNIPANQLEKWLTIEQNRFEKPVFRLFHTELEAVYEEKNISLDNDNQKAFDMLMKGVLPRHPYGKQTTIGTVEHLKNPSIEKIRDYYNAYYNPVNMALIMSGDFDPDSVIQLVDSYLGKWENKPTTKTSPQLVMPDSIVNLAMNTHDEVFTVTGPKEESIYMAYWARGAGSDDALLLYITDMVLANSQAGMLDINLNKAQKLQYAVCSPQKMKDFSFHYFIAYPKEGQSLADCKALVLEELEKLKRGEFDESILQAIVDNLRLDRAKNFNDNFSRSMDIMEAFTNEYGWENFVNMPQRLEKLTKQDIMDFAKRTYVPEKRCTVFKLQGKDTGIQKIPKPKITPIETNREAQSVFSRKINGMEVAPILPVFSNFETDIQQTTYGKGKKAVQFSYTQNKETDYFKLFIRFDMGTNNQPWLQHIADYMPYIATQTKTNEQISREFFNLACSFGFSAGDETSYIYLTGINKNFEPAYALLTEIFTNAKVDNEKWQNLVSDLLKARSDAKTNKGVILRSALKSYARYGGSKNPFTNIVSEADLQKADGNTLQQKIDALMGYQYNIWYYGPAQQQTITTQVNGLLNPTKKFKKYPKAKKFKPVAHKKPVIYFVPYDMVQAEVIWERPIKKFENNTIAPAAVFNEYFGAGMYSLVFQTIRESKALAYSCYAYISTPTDKDKPAYATAYVGTQADKLISAIRGMNQLMDSVPNDKFMGDDAKEAVRKQIAAKRVTAENLLYEQLQATKLGLTQPVDELIYNSLPMVNEELLKMMQRKAFANQNFALCIIAAKDKIDMEALKSFGEVKELSLADIFGY